MNKLSQIEFSIKTKVGEVMEIPNKCSFYENELVSIFAKELYGKE